MKLMLNFWHLILDQDMTLIMTDSVLESVAIWDSLLRTISDWLAPSQAATPRPSQSSPAQQRSAYLQL